MQIISNEGINTVLAITYTSFSDLETFINIFGFYGGKLFGI